jgi:hypothetical protein
MKLTVCGVPKKWQMRWIKQWAHLLFQVRVAVLNGERKMRDMPMPRRFHSERRRGEDRNFLPNVASGFNCTLSA